MSVSPKLSLFSKRRGSETKVARRGTVPFLLVAVERDVTCDNDIHDAGPILNLLPPSGFCQGVNLRECISLGLQVPPQKVFGPSKPTPNTFSESMTGALGFVLSPGSGIFDAISGATATEQSSASLSPGATEHATRRRMASGNWCRSLWHQFGML